MVGYRIRLNFDHRDLHAAFGHVGRLQEAIPIVHDWALHGLPDRTILQRRLDLEGPLPDQHKLHSPVQTFY